MGVSESEGCVKSFFFVACVLLCALLFALLCFVCVGVVLGGARGARGVVIGWMMRGVALLFLF